AGTALIADLLAMRRQPPATRPVWMLPEPPPPMLQPHIGTSPMAYSSPKLSRYSSAMAYLFRCRISVRRVMPETLSTLTRTQSPAENVVVLQPETSPVASVSADISGSLPL